MSGEQGYCVRCVTCGDHYWRGMDDDSDELVCTLCREEQAKHEAMRQQQEDEMNDDTEQVRSEMAADINAEQKDRAQLEAIHGQVWDTKQATAEFKFIGFCMPYVIVKHRVSGKEGTLMFQHMPRFYFAFTEC